MGSLGSTFKGSKAGSKGAGIQQAFNAEGIDFLKSQLSRTNELLRPFLNAGTGAVPELVEGSTIQGLDDRLARIFDSDTFGSLLGERTRAVEGQLAAGGLTRSGAGLQAAAGIPTDLALSLEGLLTGRNQGLASGGQNATLALGGLAGNIGNSIARLLSGSGAAGASGELADAQSKSAAGGNLANAAFSIGSLFFSDPSLKTNVEQVGQIMDLNLYQWDWKPACDGTLVAECGTVGFMADEVQEKYPHRVENFCGLMVIDYPGLLEELEHANA